MYVVMDKHDKKLLLWHLPELCQSDQPLPLQFSQEELPVDMVLSSSKVSLCSHHQPIQLSPLWDHFKL